MKFIERENEIIKKLSDSLKGVFGLKQDVEKIIHNTKRKLIGLLREL